MGFPGCSISKESACNVGDLGSIPGPRRSYGIGNGNPLQCSCLKHIIDRGAWWATVHGVIRVRYNLANQTTTTTTSCQKSVLTTQLFSLVTPQAQTLIGNFLSLKILTTNSFFFFYMEKSRKVKLLSCVRLFVTPWTAAYQAPLSMEFLHED